MLRGHAKGANEEAPQCRSPVCHSVRPLKRSPGDLKDMLGINLGEDSSLGSSAMR
jgi:hypothetical protein